MTTERAPEPAGRRPGAPQQLIVPSPTAVCTGRQPDSQSAGSGSGRRAGGPPPPSRQPPEDGGRSRANVGGNDNPAAGGVAIEAHLKVTEGQCFRDNRTERAVRCPSD